ncbi:MAG: hypothetical protein GQ527_07235 [Bacteroidales bacterium]|nr:hypothetical protein [Bacteroidales bacterium]
MNRGRVQAQGNGTEKSESWATHGDFTKSMGIGKVDDLENSLTPLELNLRALAIQKARNRIATTPYTGVDAVMKKSYYDDVRRREIRIDIEVNSGTSFIDDPAIGDENG